MTFLYKMLVILMSVSGFAAHAQVSSFCHINDPSGFIALQGLSSVLSTQASSVSVKFLLKNGAWESCSGSVVSDQGHIMTAGHCFENCAESKATSTNANPYGAYAGYGAAGYGAGERPKKCVAMIDGVETTVDIKLTSRCSFQEHQLVADAKPAQKCSNFNEVAIILPTSKLPMKPCLPLSKDFHERDRVYTIGYPSTTSRGTRDSDGTSQYASFGEIISRTNKCLITQNSWIADKENNVKQPGEVIELDELVNRGTMRGTIQTTIDIVTGNSGGPLINSNGEIVAVASFGDSQNNSEFRQCKGSTFFSPIRGIDPTVSHFSSDFQMSDVVCSKNKAKGVNGAR